MKHITAKALTVIAALSLAACSTGGDEREGGVIDVAGAIAAPQALTTDMLGKKITYVPLETTDSSLVGGSCSLVVTDRYIVMVPRREGNVQCFELASGRHVGALGHRGQDPDSYSSSTPFTNASGTSFYFNHNDSYPVEYAPDGRCLGHPAITKPLTGPLNTTVLADGTFFGVETLPNDAGYGVNIYTAKPGEPVDTLVAIAAADSIIDPVRRGQGCLGGEITSLSVRMLTNMSGRMLVFNSTGRNVVSTSVQELYNCGGNLHYAPIFGDTIYRISPAGVAPLYTINLGEDAFTVAKSVNCKNADEGMWGRVQIDTPDRIVYAAYSRGLVPEAENGWLCLYDKHDGTTRATQMAEGFTDAGGNMPPLMPMAATPDGRIVGTYDYDALADWFDNHPEAQKPEWFDSLVEDANPIVVIIE